MISFSSRKDLILIGLLLALFFFAFQTQAQKRLPSVDSDRSAPPARSLYGSLVIVSNVSDSTISIYTGKRLQVRIPVEKSMVEPLKLKPGKYTLIATHPEYKDYRQEITVRAGRIETTNVNLIPNFAFIVLTVPDIKPEARIVLDEKELQDSDLVRDSENNLRIKTTPGDHTIDILQRGYTTTPKTVTANIDEPTIVHFTLERERGILVVKTTPGARVYLNGEAKGDIPTSGELKIPILFTDEHYKIMVELIGFEKYESNITVEAGKESQHEVRLKPLPESKEFDEYFLGGLNLWNAPKEWEAQNRLLHVQGSRTVGFPKKKLFRDCEISFGLRFLDTRGAAWIIRVEDDKNYYIFYLSGPTGRFPNQLLTYICKNGQYDLNNPATTPVPLIVPLKTDESYRVRIRVVGNRVYQWITPVSSAQEISIGYFEDPNRTFTIGSAGFATVDGENFQVHGFVIKPLSDEKEN